MPYGTDVTVFVEDKTGDLGNPGSNPWWLSPDVDIPAHSGEAVQGSNDVQIRVHARDEPAIAEKIIAEVYVGAPGFVLSPSTGTRRIDPGTLRFRPAGVAGTEPVANEPGGTLSFSWIPSADADIDGPGHRCLIVRAFPESVTPPTTPFEVPTEQHEAQHNIEILSTQMDFATMSHGGAGTRKDPRRRDEGTGLWWERLATMAATKKGKRFVVWAFDPNPSKEIVAIVRRGAGKAGFGGFSKDPPGKVALEPVKAPGDEIDPEELLRNTEFAERAGLGQGLFAVDRLLGAASLELHPDELAGLLLRFDHSNLADRSAVVLHGAQWNENGDPEGGMTVVALAPVSR